MAEDQIEGWHREPRRQVQRIALDQSDPLGQHRRRKIDEGDLVANASQAGRLASKRSDTRRGDALVHIEPLGVLLGREHLLDQDTGVFAAEAGR